MIKAIVFDLDGVIVTTDECHYKAWKQTADEEGIYFDRAINDRLRGVSRAESLEIILERSDKIYTAEQKAALCDKKNGLYKEYIRELSPADILPGVNENIALLKSGGIRLAIASSSKNTPAILKQVGADGYFDAVADGNLITRSKPDPEVFLLAARLIDIPPADCLAVEDATAGIKSAQAAGMVTVALKGAEGADYSYSDLSKVNLFELVKKINSTSSNK